MNKKIIIALVGTCIVFGSLFYLLHGDRAIAEYQLVTDHASVDQANGVMLASSYDRMYEIYKLSAITKKASDKDINYIFYVMEHPISSASSAKRDSIVDGIVILESLHYTPDQSARVYNYLNPLLKSNEFGVRMWTATAFGRLGDKRRVTELIPLLHDSNSHVVSAAKRALSKLGYTS